MSEWHVIERDGWSYVASQSGWPPNAGPWRYRWEAQEYADELNAVPAGADDDPEAL